MTRGLAMSESSVEAGASGGGLDALAAELAEAVQAVAGVARLEPSLKDSLRRLELAKATKKIGPPRTTSGADGITLRVRGETVDAVIDIATRADHRAVVVADAVQHRVHDLLVTHDRQVGSISVNVLTVVSA